MNLPIRRMKMALALLLALGSTLLSLPARNTRASDHGDAPINASDQAIDQGDTYLFLDPNDNTRAVMIMTVRGFIVPGEFNNFAFFDPGVRYRFEIETTGDARPDEFIDVTFAPRTSPSTPQTATVVMPFGEIFTAPTTPPSLAASAPNPTVTTDSQTSAQFFAGVTDDPFFFDIPGFSRFRSSVLAGSPNTSALQRGRDSFAGYDIMSIAISLPISYLRLQFSNGNPTASVIGLQTTTARQRRQLLSREGGISGVGGFQTLDRSGNPALNALIIPFARKDEYNASTPQDDANGKFAADIVAALKALGTNDANIGILASVYVARGDMLRLDTRTANSGTGGGNNSGAGFPNGRRLVDDVVDTFLFLATNGAVTTGDNVNSNDVAFRSTFPFLAPPQQPRDSGVDDNTRN